VVLLYEKYLLHVAVIAPDQEWEKLSADQQRAYGQDLVKRVTELQVKLGVVAQPVINEFLANMPKEETTDFQWIGSTIKKEDASA
jgi:hypothetical protein